MPCWDHPESQSLWKKVVSALWKENSNLKNSWICKVAEVERAGKELKKQKDIQSNSYDMQVFITAKTILECENLYYCL